MRARTVPGDARKRRGGCLREPTLPCDHILICGHNPGLSEVASRLGPKPQRRTLPTAGLATAVWHHAELGIAGAGDRLQLRAGRPGKHQRPLDLTDRRARPPCKGCVRRQAPGFLGLITLQSHQPASIAFVRTRLGSGPRELREPVLFAKMRPAGGAGRCLEIMRLGFCGRTPALREPQHFEFGDDAVQRETEPIADSASDAPASPARRSGAPCRR